MKNEDIMIKVFQSLYDKLQANDFTIDKSGVKTVELIGTSIFGLNPLQSTLDFGVKKTNEDYVAKELNWYLSEDLCITGYVDDVAIWKQVASNKNIVNSNYGWCIFSKDNFNQYLNCKEALINNKETRQATMIYNRPMMHYDSTKDGMKDFCCTYYNQFFIRDNKLISIYNMRSNDAIYGYLNDLAWACYVYQQLYTELLKTYPNLQIGEIIWQAASFHVYERHFELLEKIVKGYKHD
jgi:thymidylate synthase